MRILFVSHYFPPEVNAPAYRTFDHAREWVKAGHEVTILTCVPNHPAGRIFAGYRNRFVQTETVEGLRVVRVWTFATPNEGILKRTLNHLAFMLMALLVAPFLGRADVVVTTTPQFFNGLAGVVLRWTKWAPWVLEVRDLWPESIVAVGALRARWLIAILEALERFMYRRADHIVVVTRAFAEVIAANGIARARITYVPNGIDPALFAQERAAAAPLAARLGLEGKVVATYAGTLGMAHGLETLLEAAGRLRARSDIHVLIVGDGAARAGLEQRIAAEALANVTMLGTQPKAMMPGIWALSAIGLVLLRPEPLFRTVLPSKMFEIMGTARPIILGVAGESAEVLREADAGIAIPAGDAAALAAAIAHLADRPDERARMGESGARHVRERFDRRVLAAEMLAVLMSLRHPAARPAVAAGGG